MSGTDNAAIIARIKKCLDLSERGGTEGEAAAAANMASALALKYGIDLAVVQGATGSSLRGFKECLMASSIGFQQWMMNILGGVAATYGAKTFFQSSHTGQVSYCMILRPELEEAARLTVEYLMWAITRLNRDAVKGRKLNKKGRADFRLAFRISAAGRVRARLIERACELMEKDDMAQQATGHNALVIRRHLEAEIDEMMEWMQDQGFEFKDTQHRGRTLRSAEGLLAGLAAGNSIGLEAQLTEEPVRTQITRD